MQDSDVIPGTFPATSAATGAHSPAAPTMIERMARAIVTSATEGAEPEARVALIERHWRNHVKGARAAIAAMREPTEAMIDATWLRIQTRTPETYMRHLLADPEASARAKAAERWRTMIDTALADAPVEASPRHVAGDKSREEPKP